jgi:hypothetical protein
MCEELLRQTLQRITERGDRDAQRRADERRSILPTGYIGNRYVRQLGQSPTRSILPTQYIGNGYVQQLGQSPTRSRYLSNAGLVPGELVAPLGAGQQSVIIHKKPAPFTSAKEEEDEVQFIEIETFLSYSVIPEYEFAGTNVLDAFRINITGTQLDVVVFDEEIATITPFNWVSVGMPFRQENEFFLLATFQQTNSLNPLNGYCDLRLEGFSEPVGRPTLLFEQYDWLVGRGFDGKIEALNDIQGVAELEVTYQARILTSPTEDINLITYISNIAVAGQNAIQPTDMFVRNRDSMIRFSHSVKNITHPATLERWYLDTTLYGYFLPNPRVIDQWQYSDSTGWIYWLKVQRGDDTNTAYSDQYFFGFEGKLQTLNNTKVYGKRTFIGHYDPRDFSVEYAEGETYEELIYTSSIITPQDFRDTPISSNLVFTFNTPLF